MFFEGSVRFLHAGQQVGIVLEPQDYDSLEVPADRISLGDLIAVRLGIIGGVRRRLHYFLSRLLSAQRDRKNKENQNLFMGASSIMIH
jgi:hypothetical protein